MNIDIASRTVEEIIKDDSIMQLRRIAVKSFIAGMQFASELGLQVKMDEERNNGTAYHLRVQIEHMIAEMEAGR